MRYVAYILMTLMIATAFIVMGNFIKDGLIQIKSADRFVTVKGLSERDVKADLALWPIQFKVADDDLSKAQAELTLETNLITSFLITHGIKESEVTISQVVINDAHAQQYRQNNVGTRFTIDKTILVRTNDVDAVEKASQAVGDLIAKGVLIGYNALPQYSYTKLNDVKPEMIAAATQNARHAAQQFANDSGATVGAIRSATQGYFSINARDVVSGVPSTAALYKKVRVVSTVEYYLND